MYDLEKGMSMFCPKKLIVHMLLVCSMHLFAERWSQLPTLAEGVLPNTEVVTNVLLGVDVQRLQNLHITLELDASSSNSLSIAIGEASGEELSLEEADFEWGYDCGAWFRKDTESGSYESEADTSVGRTSKTLTIPRHEIKTNWNRIRITKRGLDDIHASETKGEEFTKFIITIR